MNGFSLGDWWAALAGAEKVFWFITIISSILFIIQFVLSLIGLDSDTDVDVDLDAGAEVDTGYSLDHDFSVFSIRSIIAFFTFFGWAGVLTLRNGAGVWVAVTMALLAGLAAMFIVAYMMFKFSQLDKSGTMNVFHAIENTGEVYLSIPEKASGTGKVHVVIDGSLRELEATTKGLPLPTGTPIKVIDVLENNVLLVEAIPLLQADKD